MTDESLKDTIVPKSDQLNADDLMCGPLTITVASVKRGDKEQPVVIGIDGRQPYKPCKSMRRVLISAWGDKGADWVGKSMTLFCEPNVAWGGVRVGGIRISHLSHIDEDRTFLLTTARGKRSEFQVKRLVQDGPQKELLAFAAALLRTHYPGKSDDDKRCRAELLEEFFQTNSWKKVESLDLNELKHGINRLHNKLEGRPLYPELLLTDGGMLVGDKPEGTPF